MPKNYREITLFEEILKNGSSIRVKVTGRSMAPFLCSGQIVTIKKVALDALRKGDLIFFKNSHGTPLLHRIIQKRNSSNNKIIFRTKGDALIAYDEPVQYQSVLGKVSGIEKTNPGKRIKIINMESIRWRTINTIIAEISRFRSHLISVLTFFRFSG